MLGVDLYLGLGLGLRLIVGVYAGRDRGLFFGHIAGGGLLGGFGLIVVNGENYER